MEAGAQLRGLGERALPLTRACLQADLRPRCPAPTPSRVPMMGVPTGALRGGEAGSPQPQPRCSCLGSIHSGGLFQKRAAEYLKGWGEGGGFVGVTWASPGLQPPPPPSL